MKHGVILIPVLNLSISLIPCFFVIFFLFKWTKEFSNYIYAFIRMIGQLLIIGYILVFIFKAERWWIVILTLSFMSFTASWISLRPVKNLRKHLYFRSVFSIITAGAVIIFIVTQVVLNIKPWFSPQEMIPLAGMIFSSSMNSISLASERFFSEIKKGNDYQTSRGIALKTGLIPITNTLFAVGLVSIPGIMTGQVLSGVSPLIAVRYQIMVLAMIFSASGLSTIIYLILLKNFKHD